MTRIGFAFNLKPDSDATGPRLDTEVPRPDEEPPSSRRDNASRSSAPSTPVDGAGALPSQVGSPSVSQAVSQIDDEFAEWDSEATISAVEHALAGLGEVIRLEANE